LQVDVDSKAEEAELEDGTGIEDEAAEEEGAEMACKRTCSEDELNERRPATDTGLQGENENAGDCASTRDNCDH
jgi:hypothetical protein